MLICATFAEVMTTIGYVLIAVLCLMAMVVIHEFGHYIAGKILEERFPGFALCKKAADYGDFAGTVLAAADETAVELFLKNAVDFYGISSCIKNALQKFGLTGTIDSIEEVYRIQKEVREYTLKSIGEI